MRPLHEAIVVSFLVAASLLATACSSDGAARGGSTSGDAGSGTYWQDGDAVHGNVAVTWKNLSPRSTAGAFRLVNESSEIGTRLRKGATSSDTRVISDVEMGKLLAEMKKVGFFENAKEGLGLDNVEQTGARTGVVVVQREGTSLGLTLPPGVGAGSVANAYEESKRLVMRVHSLVPSFDIRTSTGPADESIFSAPKPPPLRRQ